MSQQRRRLIANVSDEQLEAFHAAISPGLIQNDVLISLLKAYCEGRGVAWPEVEKKQGERRDLRRLANLKTNS